ncbi:MAG TPA: YdcH family protein [Gammaproteobacteria bacterium]|nr:YdcH family protein [Gammaproteobacteria bacterium]
MTDNKVNTYIFGSMTRLKELRIAHRDLDDVIARLSVDPLVDQLQLKRLKKRKLALKDLIERLESELIPDLKA